MESPKQRRSNCGWYTLTCNLFEEIIEYNTLYNWINELISQIN